MHRGGLGGAIGDAAHIAALPGNRTDLNDPPAALRNHAPRGRLGGQERAGQVDAQHPVPILDAGIERQPVQPDAGIIDRDIDAAIALDGFRHLRLAIARFRDIRQEGACRATRVGDGRRHRLGARKIPVRTQHRRPFGGEAFRDRATEPTAGAGDQCRLSFQPHCHSP